MSPSHRILELKHAVARHLEWLRQHWWICEIWACAVCIACIVALAMIFWHYDGGTQPHWPVGMTVSSLSAILSNVIEFHLASFLGSILRQLKMLWYTRIHPLKDIKRFDDAASGPVGVVCLIWLQRGRGCASLIGFLLILHYSIGFFIQQAIAIRIADTAAGSSSIPRVMRFDQYTSGQVQQLPTIDLHIQSAIYNGLYNEDISMFEISYNCSTGSCSWPLYSSLGVGSICANLDSDIEATSCSNDTGTSKCLYSLPNGGPSINGVDATLNSTGYLNGSLFSEFPQQLVSFEVIASPGIQNATVSAIACALYLKVNEYSSEVSHGKLSERIVSSYYNSTPLAHGQPDWLIYAPSSNGTPFSMSGMSVFAEANYLWQLFTGTESGTIDQPAYSADVVQVIASSLRSGFLPDRVFNIATMVSNAMRSSGYSPSLNGSMNDSSPNAAFGTASTVQNVIKIRWPWLILPSVLSFMSVLLLVPVVLKMRTEKLERVEPGSLPWIEVAPNDASRECMRKEHGNNSVTQTAEAASYRMNNQRLTYSK